MNQDNLNERQEHLLQGQNNQNNLRAQINNDQNNFDIEQRARDEAIAQRNDLLELAVRNPGELFDIYRDQLNINIFHQ